MPVTFTNLTAGIDTPTALRRIPDTGELIVGTEDGRVLRIPAGGGKGTEVIRLSQEIRNLAVRDDASAVVVCHGNRIVEVGLAAPGAVRLPPKLDAPSAVVIDGSLVLAAEGFAPGRLVAIETGPPGVATIASAVISPVAIGVESPGGNLLVLSEYGQLSRIDRATGAISLVASGFDRPVDLAFADSERRSVLIAERGSNSILRLDLDDPGHTRVVVVGGLRKLRAIDVVDATHLIVAAGHDILLAELEPGTSTGREPDANADAGAVGEKDAAGEEDAGGGELTPTPEHDPEHEHEQEPAPELNPEPAPANRA